MTKARDNATQGGLVLLNTTTISSAAQVDFTNVFSSSYDNYRIIFTPTTSSGTCAILMRLLSGTTAATTEYYMGQVGVTQTNSSYNAVVNNGSYVYFVNIDTNNPTLSGGSCDVIRPYLSTKTVFNFVTASGDGNYFAGRAGGGTHNVASSYNGFRMYSDTSATFTGTIKIYGYK